MKRILVLLLAFSAAAMAQSSNAYVFFAPGGITSSGHTAATLQFGGGGEGILGKGIGIGVELSALGPARYFSEAIGVFSPNGYFHFVRERDRKLDPFVTAGYTLLFRSGTANLFNFGGGLNYWLGEKVGLRFEFRDHVYTQYRAEHYWGFRIGVAFR